MSTELPQQPSGLISRDELLRLTAHRGGPHVSIFLPTERAGPRTRENPIRLKNLLTTAEASLIAGGMRPTEARDLLADARALEDDYDFWQKQSDGLCLHIAPGLSTQHRLPLPFPELAVVSDRFHVRPLLELFTDDASFFLLAISMGDIRFYRCSRYGEHEVSVAGMPRNLAAALWPDDIEKQAQFRSMRSGQSGEEAIFHSSEDAQQQTKEQLGRYFRQVDAALRPVLARGSAPMILASVDYLQPIYAEANTYRNLVSPGISGNPEPELVPPAELRAQAWQLVEPLIESARADAVGRVQALLGTGRASSQIDEIVREASRGRVDTLLVAREGVVWARVSDDGETIALHETPEPGDEDLIDRAVVQTFTQGGRLYVLNRDAMPTSDPAAAIYRY